MSEHRTPTEMLMQALTKVEGAEHVVIIIQDPEGFWWDATSATESCDRERVSNLLTKAQFVVLSQCFGLMHRGED